MSPTPDSHNDPESDRAPRPEPEGSPLLGGNAPRDPRIRLAAGNVRHVHAFEESCHEDGLDLLDIARTSALTQPFGRVFSNIVGQNPAWLPKLDHKLVLKVLRAAEDSDSYRVLGCLTDPTASRSYFLDIPNSIAPLELGNSAAFICIFPRGLIDGNLDPGDEDTHQLIFRSLLDNEAFERELSAFADGAGTGLFKTVVTRRLIDQNRTPEPIRSVDRSVERDNSFCALMVRFDSGSAVIEIFRDTASGASNFGELRFLSPGARPSQDFFYDVRTPATVRKHVVADLFSRDLKPMEDLDWVRNAKRVFGRTIEQLFTDPVAPTPLFVEVKQLLARGNGSHIFDLVAEAELRRADRSFVVPTLKPGEMLRCPEPASLFYSLTPVDSPTGERQVLYRLSHLALPPCGGVEGIVEAMMKAPDRSLLTEPVIAVLGADLGLQESELATLKLTAIIPLAVVESNTIEITAENANADRNPVFLICAHTKGAHMVAINRTGSGLLNVIEDIVPLHFFPRIPV